MSRRRRRAAICITAFLSAAATLAAGPGGEFALGEDAAPRLECEHPRQLRLVRYEDLSARLYCGRRLMVRISVPY